jgi:hypothetical protein
MSRNRFIVPGVTHLDLSDGDWIEVHNEIGYGEQQSLSGMAAMMREPSDIKCRRYREWSVQRMLTWIADWSLCDAKGDKVDLSEDAVAALEPATGDEIDAKLTEHIAAWYAAKNPAAPGKARRRPKSAS